MISPNRDALKTLANLMIDFRFLNNEGSALFNYSGEESEQIKNIKLKVLELIEGMNENLEFIKKEASI